MESPDLKPSPSDDPAFEAWLQRHAALPPLRDGDFSRDVLAALPAPARSSSTRRTWLCVAATLAGLIVAARPVLSGENILERLPSADAALTAGFAQLATPAMGLALVATATSLLWAFWGDVRRHVRL